MEPAEPRQFPLADADYKALSAFRHALRRFIHFSESAAKAAGLTPQQHQALLTIRGAPNSALAVGELAELLMIQPHSASELADRLAVLGLVIRRHAPQDRRIMLIQLSEGAGALLHSLSVAHRDELLRMRPLLGDLLAKLD